jgi:pimeloyl-ACP methyl ester carboxylesterase
VRGGLEGGEGPLLLLLPGIRGDGAEFERLVPLLTGWRIRVATYPEAGAAEPLPAPTSPGVDGSPMGRRGLAETAQRVLDGFDGRAHVLGASFGGLVGWALPQARVRSLTTIGTAPGPSSRTRRAAWTGIAMQVAPDRLYREVYGRRARGSMADDGADEALLLRTHLPSRAAMAKRLAAIGAWDLPERPAVPSTWLWGATDPFVTWDNAAVRRIGATPVIVPGGHRPHLSHPSELARWLPGPDRP